MTAVAALFLSIFIGQELDYNPDWEWLRIENRYMAKTKYLIWVLFM